MNSISARVFVLHSGNIEFPYARGCSLLLVAVGDSLAGLRVLPPQDVVTSELAPWLRQ